MAMVSLLTGKNAPVHVCVYNIFNIISGIVDVYQLEFWDEFQPLPGLTFFCIVVHHYNGLENLDGVSFSPNFSYFIIFIRLWP